MAHVAERDQLTSAITGSSGHLPLWTSTEAAMLQASPCT
jgi:hypothetical protein